MIFIKISQAASDKDFNRQLPKGDFFWKDCHFFINEAIKEADFWVVCYQRLPGKKETCYVAPENTIYVTWEPDSVWHFSKGFLNQFGKVISCQKHLSHHNVVNDQPGLAWHIGMVRKDGINIYNKTYDDFMSLSPDKTKLISVISSNKSFSKGHRERIAFVEKLKAHFGDQLDVFGRGIRPFGDKWDVIAPYQYHICLENCAQPYYWSEKLADAYLGEAFPFYYGCTNISDYFEEDSYRAIDILKPDQAINIIEKSLLDNLANSNRPAVKKSKLKVLNEYNFFELVHKHIQGMDPHAKKERITIKDDLSFFDPYKIPILGNRFLNTLKHRIYD